MFRKSRGRGVPRGAAQRRRRRRTRTERGISPADGGARARLRRDRVTALRRRAAGLDRRGEHRRCVPRDSAAGPRLGRPRGVGDQSGLRRGRPAAYGRLGVAAGGPPPPPPPPPRTENARPPSPPPPPPPSPLSLEKKKKPSR